jgi:nucleotide-binding universal stress UspA family protein
MFRNILMAADGSEASIQAAREAIEIARAFNARVTVVTVTVPWVALFAREMAVVVPDVVVPQTEYDARRATVAESILHNVAQDVRSAGLAVKAIHRSHSQPYVAILDVAAMEHCDLIVVGCHAHAGITGSLPGSESMKLVAESKIPVLVCRSSSQRQFLPSPMI